MSGTAEESPSPGPFPAGGSGYDDGGGHLVGHVAGFARLLREAGLAIGPGKVLQAVEALRLVRITDRDEFYWALHAVFVSRRQDHLLFDEAFRLFWRDPATLPDALAALLAGLRRLPGKPLRRRLADALGGQAPGDAPTREREEASAEESWSDQERLRQMDFETMSAAELAEARRVIERMPPFRPVPVRRLRPAAGGRIDPRATLRAALRGGGAFGELRRRKPWRRPPPLVALCDISGSMSAYTKPLLTFLHALVNRRERVKVFLFGTRLTNVTRHLERRDPDQALERVSGAVTDWAGGTRIGACMREFNLRWSRRVLAQGAVVLLLTDGLDREAGAGLEAEVERLRRSARRLVWLNPLLRYEGFEPKAAGVRAILAHVDEHRPVHNLASIGALAAALAGRPGRPPARRLRPSRA